MRNSEFGINGRSGTPVSRLPPRSVLLLRNGVHWTPAPYKIKLTIVGTGVPDRPKK